MSEDLRLEKKGQGGVEAVDRAISILLSFRAGEQPVTLTTLCERTGLHKTTVLRIAESLERFDMLHRLPDKRYRPGPAVMQLASVFGSMVGLPEAAREPCDTLMNMTHLSVSLYVRQGESRVCVLRADPPDSPKDIVEVGATRPLDATATGLAFRRYQDVVSAGERSDPIFTLGIYNPGMSSMAYPVFGAHDRLVAVLTLSGSSAKFDMRPVSALVPDVAQTARQIEKALGRLFENSEAARKAAQP